VKQRGFAWGHWNWIMVHRHSETEWDRVKDFSKYPELRFLNEYHSVFDVLTPLILFLVGGFELMIWGYFISTVLLWHGTFTINSLAHVWGRRVYETTDTSRNNAVLAVITGGEGWHNNHHRYPWSARQGFRWWQVDVTYYVLRAFSWLGIVRDIRPVPSAVRAEARRLPPGV
jgi:stearoyl-CoA desaturase (delta-9 desaturase)